MEQAPELVTVYRSMDQTAKEDCETILDLLTNEGIPATVLDDQAPGVPEGVFEVQTPAAHAARAEKLIADNPLPDEVVEVDDSPELDLETIFHSEGNISAEMEASAVKSVLEANGVAVVMVGDSVLPNFAFEIKVAKEHADKARALIAEVQQGGRAAADAAELESERQVAAEEHPSGL